MAQRPSKQDESLRRFYRRVWKQDVAPLLRGRRKVQRGKTARATGQIAGSAGLLADKLLGLKGRPFARFMTVMGSSLGAMLPDVWDWEWLQTADESQRKVVDQQVRRRAAELPEAEALQLFGLSASASRDDLRRAWHKISLKYHPDRAGDAAQRAEYHLRFMTFSAAHERLCQAYEAGRLPTRAKREEPRRD